MTLRRIEQEAAALSRRWGELREEVVALALAAADPARIRAGIEACDQAQAGLVALDAQRRALMQRPPDRGYVAQGLGANRAAWLTATHRRLMRHVERADHATRDRLELAALVFLEAAGPADAGDPDDPSIL